LTRFIEFTAPFSIKGPLASPSVKVEGVTTRYACWVLSRCQFKWHGICRYFGKSPTLCEPFFPILKEFALFLYQIKIDIRRYKTEELVKSMRFYARNFRKEKGFLGSSVYWDFEKENTFSVIGEWKIRQAMEKHLKNNFISLLLSKHYGYAQRID
jgi:quinol monooxygenase YgiN